MMPNKIKFLGTHPKLMMQDIYHFGTANRPRPLQLNLRLQTYNIYLRLVEEKHYINRID